MSFLNPMTYVRGAGNAAKAIAGRSYYVDGEGRLVALRADGTPGFDGPDRADTYGEDNAGKGGV
jgi:hypothetical protein